MILPARDIRIDATRRQQKLDLVSNDGRQLFGLSDPRRNDFHGWHFAYQLLGRIHLFHFLSEVLGIAMLELFDCIYTSAFEEFGNY